MVGGVPKDGVGEKSFRDLGFNYSKRIAKRRETQETQETKRKAVKGVGLRDADNIWGTG